MKATMEIPDDLYRRVEAKSALEGRPVKDVAVELFRDYVDEPAPSRQEPVRREPILIDGEPAPAWFGVFREQAQRVARHDMESIRKSIAVGIAAERG